MGSMKAVLSGVVLLFLCCTTFGARPQLSDRPASAISVTDAYLPYQVVLDGFVILDLSLDSHGSITAIHILRDPGSMVSAAIASVRTWKFEPAIEDSEPQPSEMTVAFVYRPADSGGSKAVLPKPFAPVLPRMKNEAHIPAGIVSVAYPEYPVNSVAWGSVIVQASLDKTGAMKKAEVLRGQEPFTAFALESLKKWSFQTAKLHDKPTQSNVAIAFVFESPVSN
jgi:outer membrane biosynthesis protein TonB